ncbi:MAG: hypothetical protein UCH84_05270 [Eubacterium sp.]|nr:hypothetical protein [Eubacterium sp.]
MVRRKKSVCIAIVMILSILFSTNNQAYTNNTENEITNIAQVYSSTDTEGKRIYENVVIKH